MSPKPFVSPFYPVHVVLRPEWTNPDEKNLPLLPERLFVVEGDRLGRGVGHTFDLDHPQLSRTPLRFEREGDHLVAVRKGVPFVAKCGHAERLALTRKGEVLDLGTLRLRVERVGAFVWPAVVGRGIGVLPLPVPGRFRWDRKVVGGPLPSVLDNDELGLEWVGGQHGWRAGNGEAGPVVTETEPKWRISDHFSKVGSKYFGHGDDHLVLATLQPGLCSPEGAIFPLGFREHHLQQAPSGEWTLAPGGAVDSILNIRLSKDPIAGYTFWDGRGWVPLLSECELPGGWRPCAGTPAPKANTTQSNLPVDFVVNGIDLQIRQGDRVLHSMNGQNVRALAALAALSGLTSSASTIQRPHSVLWIHREKIAEWVNHHSPKTKHHWDGELAALNLRRLSERLFEVGLPALVEAKAEGRIEWCIRLRTDDTLTVA